MILMLIFLVLLLQRGVQASQPIPINVINLEKGQRAVGPSHVTITIERSVDETCKELPAVSFHKYLKECTRSH